MAFALLKHNVLLVWARTDLTLRIQTTAPNTTHTKSVLCVAFASMTLCATYMTTNEKETQQLAKSPCLVSESVVFSPAGDTATCCILNNGLKTGLVE